MRVQELASKLPYEEDGRKSDRDPCSSSRARLLLLGNAIPGTSGCLSGCAPADGQKPSPSPRIEASSWLSRGTASLELLVVATFRAPTVPLGRAPLLPAIICHTLQYLPGYAQRKGGTRTGRQDQGHQSCSSTGSVRFSLWLGAGW